MNIIVMQNNTYTPDVTERGFIAIFCNFAESHWKQCVVNLPETKSTA